MTKYLKLSFLAILLINFSGILPVLTTENTFAPWKKKEQFEEKIKTLESEINALQDIIKQSGLTVDSCNNLIINGETVLQYEQHKIQFPYKDKPELELKQRIKAVLKEKYWEKDVFSQLVNMTDINMKHGGEKWLDENEKTICIVKPDNYLWCMSDVERNEHVINVKQFRKVMGDPLTTDIEHHNNWITRVSIKYNMNTKIVSFSEVVDVHNAGFFQYSMSIATFNTIKDNSNVFTGSYNGLHPIIPNMNVINEEMKKIDNELDKLYKPKDKVAILEPDNIVAVVNADTNSLVKPHEDDHQIALMDESAKNIQEIEIYHEQLQNFEPKSQQDKNFNQSSHPESFMYIKLVMAASAAGTMGYFCGVFFNKNPQQKKSDNTAQWKPPAIELQNPPIMGQ